MDILAVTSIFFNVIGIYYNTYLKSVNPLKGTASVKKIKANLGVEGVSGKNINNVHLIMKKLLPICNRLHKNLCWSENLVPSINERPTSPALLTHRLGSFPINTWETVSVFPLINIAKNFWLLLSLYGNNIPTEDDLQKKKCHVIMKRDPQTAR
jgi:hypothetical protein